MLSMPVVAHSLGLSAVTNCNRFVGRETERAFQSQQPASFHLAVTHVHRVAMTTYNMT